MRLHSINIIKDSLDKLDLDEVTLERTPYLFGVTIANAKLLVEEVHRLRHLLAEHLSTEEFRKEVDCGP